GKPDGSILFRPQNANLVLNTFGLRISKQREQMHISTKTGRVSRDWGELLSCPELAPGIDLPHQGQDSGSLDWAVRGADNGYIIQCANRTIRSSHPTVTNHMDESAAGSRRTARKKRKRVDRIRALAVRNPKRCETS